MNLESIPTILSVVFGLMTVLLSAALSTTVYLVILSLRNISTDVRGMRAELTEVATQLRSEAREDRDELHESLGRVHRRVDAVPSEYVKREDCIVAQNRLGQAITRIDDKVDCILKALKLRQGGEGEKACTS